MHGLLYLYRFNCCLGSPKVPVIFVSGQPRQRPVICRSIEKRSRVTTRPDGIWLMEAIKAGDGTVVGIACPFRNSIDSFSREIDGRGRSYCRRTGEALTVAESMGVVGNHEGRKFSVQRQHEALN
jgi:hypothetical protein